MKQPVNTARCNAALYMRLSRNDQTIYELIVKGLKEAIENEKNKGKEIEKRDNQVNFDKQ